MAKRPTIEQLAKASGVSVATVDRVLNKRLPVRGETAHRVHEAAGRIGFHAAGLIGQRIREELPEVRLGFLLLKSGQQFYAEFARQLQSTAAAMPGIRAVCHIDFASSQAPDEILSKLDALAARAKAVAVVAPAHPSLTAAVARLREVGGYVF